MSASFAIFAGRALTRKLNITAMPATIATNEYAKSASPKKPTNTDDTISPTPPKAPQVQMNMKSATSRIRTPNAILLPVLALICLVSFIRTFPHLVIFDNYTILYMQKQAKIMLPSEA